MASLPRADTDFIPNRRKALAKLVLLVVGFLIMTSALIFLIDDSAFNQIKFELSLGTMILLVVAINLVCFACFILMYVAYQWIRCDLKAPRSEDIRDDE